MAVALKKLSDLAEVTAVLNCREHPVALLAGDRTVLTANRAYEQEFGNGFPVLGRRCYEVSHGFDVPCDEAGVPCPLRVAEAHGQTQNCIHVHCTAHGEVHHSVSATPVVDDGDRLLGYLETIRPNRLALSRPDDERMVGRSSSFNRMLEMVERVAHSETPVLLLGESGTGKELVARAVHDLSRRSSRSFVPVDCSGLSESLFESELFGHVKGAFTGAYTGKPGLVEAASGGTLFLDEVGDIPLSLQVKLLRLLESGVYRRVGSVDPVRADFRLVCATHRALDEMVDEGTFRHDLYYRLSAFPITLPPLRERPDDIELLARTLLERICPDRSIEIDPAAMELLRRHDYRGNVRELRNLLERACLLADGDTVLATHLPATLRTEGPGPTPIPVEGRIVPLDEVERMYLQWAVARFRGDNADLARLLGLSERTLYRKLHRLREEHTV